ncbi:tripartite tricarboxylate transporter TctB family protein [Qaidamihabitans albus]|uniref:tripartite tricarboxylate transporter TctB family protein n=1 Tax=Qaidamihabitans albus TaxID=2795733 RepID=UPI0018F18BAF|nr:tripartite tricarboxylate transporter TctB family protein [Qaidamihabitans albus]
MKSTTHPAAMPGRLFRPNADLAGAAVLATLGLVSLSQMGDDIRNWIFPRVLTYTLFAVAVMLVVSGVWKVVQGRPSDLRMPAAAMGVVIFAAGAVVYAVSIALVGFWVPSFFMLALASVFLSATRNWRTALVSSVIALAACVGAYLVFTQLFFVALPQG